MSTVRRFGEYEVEITNAEKVLFPRDGLTKGDLIDYYSRISTTILPYMRGRPVTMVRYPDGIDGESFFQKGASPFFPSWLRKVAVPKKGGSLEQVICEKKADLVYLANLACVTPHIWLSREPHLDRPDRMIFDLDPSDDDFAPVRHAALGLRDELDKLGLSTFPMTTGSRGIHVVVPLDGSSTFDQVREFSQTVAGRMAQKEPDKYSLEVAKEWRKGKLLIDTFRNAYAQTGVAPYAVRAKDGAPVATPLEWSEVEAGRIGPRTYNIKNIFDRLEDKGDPMKGIDDRASSLKKADGKTWF
jgi:bifunctional non-homologous end joining protein LigD